MLSISEAPFISPYIYFLTVSRGGAGACAYYNPGLIVLVSLSFFKFSLQSYVCVLSIYMYSYSVVLCLMY